ARHGTGLRLYDSAFMVEFIHCFLGETPNTCHPKKLVLRVTLRCFGPPGCRDITQLVMSTVSVAITVERVCVILIVSSVLHVPRVLLRLGVEENRLMNSTKMRRTLGNVAFGCLAFPD